MEAEMISKKTPGGGANSTERITTLEEQAATYSMTIAQLETENSTLTSTLDALLSDVLPVLMGG